MSRRRRIYEAKAKVLYEGPEPGTLVQYFKDDASAFNNKKKGVITGKGVLNNPHLRAPDGAPQRDRRAHPLHAPAQHARAADPRGGDHPVEVIIRNFAAGTLVKRLGLKEGAQLPRSIVEYCYKNDELDDPLVSEEHITAFGWATPQELDDILSMSLRINDFLSGLFHGIGIRLVDFKLEFGRLWHGEDMRIVLADEISPDSCRLWDLETDEKLDKDRFRRDLGRVSEAYQEVARRLGLMPEAVGARGERERQTTTSARETACAPESISPSSPAFSTPKARRSRRPSCAWGSPAWATCARASIWSSTSPRPTRRRRGRSSTPCARACSPTP